MPEFDILNGVEPVVPVVAEEEDILDGIEEEGSFDPAVNVHIISAGGGSNYVPVEGPTAFSTVLAQSGLHVGGAVEFWMNGVRIEADTTVPAGSTVTIVGSVKGG